MVFVSFSRVKTVFNRWGIIEHLYALGESWEQWKSTIQGSSEIVTSDICDKNSDIWPEWLKNLACPSDMSMGGFHMTTPPACRKVRREHLM